MSKIKNKITNKKKRIEKGLRLEFLFSIPHSKEFILSRLFFSIQKEKIKIILIKIIVKISLNKIIIIILNKKIFKNFY